MHLWHKAFREGRYIHAVKLHNAFRATMKAESTGDPSGRPVAAPRANSLVFSDPMQTVQTRHETRRLLTVAETAAYLNCSPLTVRRLIWDCKLPAVKWDRRPRVDTRDLERFVERHKERETV